MDRNRILAFLLIPVFLSLIVYFYLKAGIIEQQKERIRKNLIRTNKIYFNYVFKGI